MRIPNVALIDIPQPFFVPQRIDAEGEVASIEDDLPGIFTELHEGRGLVLTAAETPPTLDFALG